MAIISLEEYKQSKGINSPTRDSELSPIVDFVNSFIPRYCNTDFVEVSDYTDRLDASLGEILLSNAPVTSVTSITILSDSTIIDSDKYLVNNDIGEVVFLDEYYELTTTNYNLSIVYDYGFTVVPPDIVNAANDLVTHYINSSFYTAKNSARGDSISFSQAVQLPQHIRLVLDMYRYP